MLGASQLAGDPNDLDAGLIDIATLRFGPDMDNIAPVYVDVDIDIDSDGIDDALFQFQMSDAGFGCADSSGTLSFALNTGVSFEGSDSIDSDCNAACH